MNDKSEDNLDQLLREHFANQLDPQLGKSMPILPHPARLRWWSVYAGAGLAAAIVGLLLLHPVAVNSTNPASASAMQDLHYELNWQIADAGTVFLDPDTPMKAYVQQAIETAQWVDPATHSVVNMTIPQQQVILVGMNTY